MRKQHVLLSLLFVSVTSTASPYYLGVKIGKSWLSEHCSSSEIDCVNDNPAYGILGGIQFNKSWSLESSYEDLGTFTVNSLNSDSIRLLTVAPKLTIPISTDYQWYTKVGAAYTNISNHHDGTYFAATGLEYNLRPQMKLRVEYLVASDINDGSNRYLMNGASVGISYSYGSTQQAVHTHDESSISTSIETGSTTLPSAALRTSYTYNELGFDSHHLSDAHQQAIIELATMLNHYPKTHILIIGYTDTTGPEAYNRKLSIRRAQTVADLLIANHVAEDRIQVQGLGNEHPIASNNTKYGRAQNRRVEIKINTEE